MKNPFAVGDYVTLKDDPSNGCWQVNEIKGRLCFISDIGEEVSNVVQLWASANELENYTDDEDEYEDEDESQ